MTRVTPVRHWWLRALLWAVSACVLGPLALGLVVGLAGIPAFPDLRAALGNLLGVTLLSLFMYVPAGAIIGLPAFIPLLMLWGRFGPRLGRIETTWWGVALGTFVLAALAALGIVLVLTSTPSPSGPSAGRGWEVAALALPDAWIALLLPRWLVPGLRLGVFG